MQRREGKKKDKKQYYVERNAKNDKSIINWKFEPIVHVNNRKDILKGHA